MAVRQRPESEASTRPSNWAGLHFEILFESSADGILIWELPSKGSPGRVRQANDALCRMLGYTHDEVLELAPIDLLAGTDQAAEDGEDPECASRECRKTLLAKHGGLVQAEITTREFHHRRRQLRMSVIRDISERARAEAALREAEQAEEALRESETRLRLAQVAAGAGVWDWDIPSGRLQWSEELFSLFGLDPEPDAASFERWRSVLYPDDRDPAEQRILTALAEHASLSSEYRIVLPSGEIRWIYALGNTNYDSTGKPLRMSGICLDITHRKRAEERLRQIEEEQKVAEALHGERQRLLDILETLPTMISLLTADRHVDFANRSFRENFGEPAGRPCYECCFGRTEPCESCETLTVLQTGVPRHWEKTHPGGSVVDIYDFPFTDVDGTPMILKMEVDITKHRQIERELRSAHADLAARAAQLRALAGELTLAEQRERRRMAKVLHDHLQQLLVGAKFRTVILGRSGDDITKQAASEIEHLLDESISVSRSLTAELSPPIIYEGGLPEGLQWLARWVADKYGLIVDLSIEEGLPSLLEDIRILLFESVRELLFNAVKHAHARSVTVNVRQVEGNLVQITVSDLGPGFEPANLKKAGEIGGGFGLFGIRERLNLIGGKMEIDSAPGRGSRFTLIAPWGRDEQAEQPPVAVAPPRTGLVQDVHSPTAKAAIRLLLADDHKVTREGLRRLLDEEPDMLVIGEAADGEEAVQLARSLSPDVILMDLSMPKLNGIEATRIIHNDYPDIRIIGLSMFEEEERAQALRDAGAVQYLTKSGPSSDLIAAIRSCLHRRVGR